jgi:GNAT superfamily N-acetyltransferase
MTTVIRTSGIGFGAREPRLLPERVRIAPIHPDDLDPLLAMLARCTPATLRRRFHGFTDGVAYTREQVRTSDDRIAVGAWEGPVCIGVADLVGGVPGPWHLSVLVEDDRQRQGIGNLLVSNLVGRARATGVPRLRADLSGDDALLAGMIRRIGPSEVSLDRGTITIEVDLSTVGPAPAG